MTYNLNLTTRAEKYLDRLSDAVASRITARILELKNNPRPYGIIKLKGTESLYRIRVGEYRVIYQILDDVLLILVVKIGHRKDVYRNK